MAKRIEQEVYTSPLAARTVPEDTCHELALAWDANSPVTTLRPVEPRDGATQSTKCEGSAGNYQLECLQPVVAVQHTVSTGEPRFYCYGHALETDGWDDVHYRSSPVEVPDLTEDQLEFIEECLRPKRRRKREETGEL